MGKKSITILKVKKYSVYPLLGRQSHADKQGNRPLYLRVKDGKKTIDIELYDANNVRIKALTKYFENGKITGGYTTDLINQLNNRVHNLQSKLIEYLPTVEVIDKQLIMNHLYGNTVHGKSKRTKYITLPVNHNGKVIDTLQLTNVEVNELIKPLMSKQTFINSDGKTKTVESIFDAETGEDLIQSEDDLIEVIVQADNDKKISKANKARLLEIAQMDAKSRYLQGHYDKNNIFDVLGQVLVLNKSKTKPYSKNWKAVILKLYQYRERNKPNESIKSLTHEWVINFIQYVKDNGYHRTHVLNFNPLNYDASHLTKGEVYYYNDLTIQKLIKCSKEIFRFFGEENLLPEIKVNKIRYDDFNVGKVFQETEKEFYLSKSEIDKLFYYDFKDEKLTQARDLFICQFYFGGLRPDKELLGKNSINILPDGKGGKKVSYIISKDTGEVNENPIVSYSDLTMKKYDYDFEKLRNGITYTQYSALLKKIAFIFDREIIKYEQNDGKLKMNKTNVNKEFTSYFARRSFEQILNQYGVNHADTTAFTGRKLNLGSIKNYRSFTYEQKKAVMKKIKPI